MTRGLLSLATLAALSFWGCQAVAPSSAYRDLKIGMSSGEVSSLLRLRYPPTKKTTLTQFGTMETWTLCWDWLNGWDRDCDGKVMGGPIVLHFQNGVLVTATY